MILKRRSELFCGLVVGEVSVGYRWFEVFRFRVGLNESGGRMVTAASFEAWLYNIELQLAQLGQNLKVVG